MQKDMRSCRDGINLLMETSWEVCNKIGGIYTVLSTKARVLQAKYGDRLIFIGPDVWTEENRLSIFRRKENVVEAVLPSLNCHTIFRFEWVDGTFRVHLRLFL